MLSAIVSGSRHYEEVSIMESLAASPAAREWVDARAVPTPVHPLKNENKRSGQLEGPATRLAQINGLAPVNRKDPGRFDNCANGNIRGQALDSTVLLQGVMNKQARERNGYGKRHS